jgi:murein L,D-transpeptidase YafK
VRISVATRIAGAFLGGLLLVSGWDYFQISRTMPAMAEAAERATVIVVDKQARKLTLLRHADVLRSYDVVLGRTPIGPKEREGDGRTPEGRYVIDSKNPRSHAHLALHISYPSAGDLTQARRLGVSPGGDIMIHGLLNGLGWFGAVHRAIDWTNGCIAVTNSQIEEIWSLVDVGTPIEIKP